MQGCIAASAIPVATALPWAPAFARATGPTFYRTIIDERFTEGVAFGREADRMGETTRSIRGDVTQVWYNEIAQKWREEPVPIAGLTAHGPLFCLERWAWDAGLRIVFRAEHSATEGRIHHVLAGPQRTIAGAQLRASGPDWAAQMARLAIACRHDTCAPAQTSFAGHTGSLSVPDDEALISWVIAPARRT